MACGGGGGGEGGVGCGGGKGGEGGRVARLLRCTCCCASTMHSARTFAWHFVSSLIVASSPSSALSLWISSACVISLHAPGGGEWPPERVLGGEVHRRAGRGDVACTHCATVSVDFVSPSCSLAAQVSPVLMAASRTDAARAAMVKDHRHAQSGRRRREGARRTRSERWPRVLCVSVLVSRFSVFANRALRAPTCRAAMKKCRHAGGRDGRQGARCAAS